MTSKNEKRLQKTKKEEKLKKVRLQKKKEYKRKNKNLQTTEKFNINPKCINEYQQICLSSSGYFTPCCWFDDELYRDQPWVKTLFREHLKIENNESLEDIFNSKEWTELFDMLINNPKDAPPICKKMCGSELITEKQLESKPLGNDSKIDIRIRN